jgi:hypothetical protein
MNAMRECSLSVKWELPKRKRRYSFERDSKGTGIEGLKKFIEYLSKITPFLQTVHVILSEAVPKSRVNPLMSRTQKEYGSSNFHGSKYLVFSS